ncbi:zinc-dependent alcohol dehydrogenase [Benzoatithermus flavus]|uniref:Zinc-binding alcohol dehydrogenase n=1 Tax=Benzoatithermus flavus TaxID=3108223 RepID=A0ABU8XY22_9PROT
MRERAVDALAYWATGPGRGELRPCRLPPPGKDDVLVRTLFSGVSRGTEALVAAGRVPPSQHQVMRAPFQEGSFPFPVKYGYSSVGRVTAGADDLLGRLVFCLHPHQTAYVVPRAAVMPLPPGLPPERAVLAANMETALNALWDAAPRAGERIHVIGAGVVGCLVARLCRQIPGAEVTLADILPERADVAVALDVAFAPPDRLAGDADLVLHASGQGEGLRTALAVAGREGRIVELSWYGTAEVALPLGEAFHSRRLTIASSQVGQVAPAMRPRWSHARRLAKALELLCDPALDALLTGEVAFGSLPELMPRLLAPGGHALCHRIVYPGSEQPEGEPSHA